MGFRWIVFTGIDGVGKTTLSKYAKQILGKKCAYMKIPHFDWVRDMIKLSGDNEPLKDPHTDMLIFSAGNRLEMHLIDKVAKEHKFLVTQRCWLDNFPYRSVQGTSLQTSFNFLKPERFRKPDILFFLKCPYGIAYERIADANGDKYETLNFMKSLEKEFNKMFDDIHKKKFPIDFSSTKIIEVDATKDIPTLKKQIKEYLDEFILDRKNVDKCL